MEAQFNSVSLKVFNQALAAISRFGDKLFILGTHDEYGCPEVRLSVLNSSRTGFCSVYFREDFFESLTCAVGQDIIEASINIRALQSIVKNTRSSKNVEACELSFIEEGIEDLLSIRLHCQHGVTKTHKLPYEPKNQSLPNGPPEDSPNYLIMSPNCARNWTDHFLGPKSGEISLWVTNRSCVVRSSEDIAPLNPTKASKDSAGNRMQITTEVVVSVSDFEEFNIGQETSLTFNLKEFKSMTLLSEQLNCSLELIFTVGNEPIHIFLKKEKVVLVCATLASHAHDIPLIAAGVKTEAKTSVGGAGAGAIIPSGNSIVNGLKVHASGASSRDREPSAASSSAARHDKSEVEGCDGERLVSPEKSRRPKPRPVGKGHDQDGFASDSNPNSNSHSSPNPNSQASPSASGGAGRGSRSVPLPMESTPRENTSKQRSITPRIGAKERDGPLFLPSASQQSSQNQDLDLDMDMDDDGVDFGGGDFDGEALEAEIASGALEVKGSQSQAFKDRVNKNSQNQRQAANQRESQPTESEVEEGDLETKTTMEPISSTPRNRAPDAKSSSSDGDRISSISSSTKNKALRQRDRSPDQVRKSSPGPDPSQSQQALDYDERAHQRAREKARKRSERDIRNREKAMVLDKEKEKELAQVNERERSSSRPLNRTDPGSEIPSSLIVDTIYPTPVSQGGDSLEHFAYQEGIESEVEAGQSQLSQEDSEAVREAYDHIPMNSTNLDPNPFARTEESYGRELMSSSLARQERASGEMQEIRRLERLNNHQLEGSSMSGVGQEVERGELDEQEDDEIPPSQPKSSLVESDNEDPNQRKKKRRVQSFKPKF